MILLLHNRYRLPGGEEAEQLPGCGVDRGVARDVDAARLAVGEVAAAVRSHQPLRLRVLRVVLHDHDLGAVRGRLRADRRERHREVLAAPAGREQQRGGRRHAPESLGSRAG